MKGWRMAAAGAVLAGWLLAGPLASDGHAAAMHTVRRGESLWSISRAHGASVSALRAANGLWASAELQPGRRLVVPLPGERVHVVSPGESLWAIGRWYGVSAAAIQRANGLPTGAIHPGQGLVIPPGPTPAAAPGRSASAPRAGSKSPAARLTADEVRLLAQLVTAEAGGEPYLGQVAVAAAVLNRLESSLFPDTLRGVIFQHRQFEPVLNGRIWNPPTASALRAVHEALAGHDPTGGALFFYNPGKAQSSFFWNRTYLGRIGAHAFYA